MIDLLIYSEVVMFLSQVDFQSSNTLKMEGGGPGGPSAQLQISMLATKHIETFAYLLVELFSKGIPCNP